MHFIQWRNQGVHSKSVKQENPNNRRSSANRNYRCAARSSRSLDLTCPVHKRRATVASDPKRSIPEWHDSLEGIITMRLGK